MYVKCRAAGAPLIAGELARFDLVVEDVLEDAAAEGEEGARITGGVTYAPVPALDSDWARATLGGTPRSSAPSAPSPCPLPLDGGERESRALPRPLRGRGLG